MMDKISNVVSKTYSMTHQFTVIYVIDTKTNKSLRHDGLAWNLLYLRLTARWAASCIGVRGASAWIDDGIGVMIRDYNKLKEKSFTCNFSITKQSVQCQRNYFFAKFKEIQFFELNFKFENYCLKLVWSKRFLTQFDDRTSLRWGVVGCCWFRRPACRPQRQPHQTKSLQRPVPADPLRSRLRSQSFGRSLFRHRRRPAMGRRPPDHLHNLILIST